MNNIYAIIFDLDGVICSTDRYHYLAWKALADRLRIPFDEQVNSQLRGVSRMESLEIVLGEHSADYSEEQKEALATEKNEIYKSYLSSMTPRDLPKEVRMTLHMLRQRGYLLAIGSSSKNTQQILKQLGLGDFFDAVADGTLDVAYGNNHLFQFIRFQRCRVIRPRQSPVEGKVFFNHRGSTGSSGNRHLNSHSMVGVTTFTSGSTGNGIHCT